MNIKNLFQKPQPKKMNATTRRATMPIAEDYDTDEPNVRLSRAFLVVMLLHVVAVGGILAFSSLKKSTPEDTDAPVAAGLSEKAPVLPSDSRLYVVSGADTLGSIASTFGITRNDLEAANHLSENSSIKPGDKLVIPAKSTAQPVPLNVQKLLQLSQNQKAETAAPTAPAAQTKVAAPPKVVTSTKAAPAAPVSVPATAPKPVAAAEPVPAGEGKIYVVQKGDNPVLIAKKNGIKYVDLVEANKIMDPKKLQIGQKLIIPQK
ncbi:MAG TPA: LysM peptidoglycan-binding domain-containing protein [Chthoniobacterales bacterium]|jgi:LysM repeat protein